VSLRATATPRSADLCPKGDIRGIGRVRPCVRVLMCGKCDRPLVAEAPTCGECSYCQKRLMRHVDRPWWAGADWARHA